MIKRIFNFVKKDISNALRDNIIIYMIIFPLLMAVGFRLIIPSLQEAKATFAVSPAVGKQFVEKLKNYGSVIICENYETLAERVERPDDVPGITKEGDRYIVLAEGNETGSIEEIAGAIIDSIVQENPMAEFQRISLGRTSSKVKETTASILMLSSIIIAGMLIGLNMVDEKENKTIRSLAVSPMTMTEYIGARAVTALVVAMVLSVLSSLILMGFNTDYGKIYMGVLVSVSFSIIMGLIMGGLANDQMTAIAIMKIAMLLAVWIPLSSLFVPKAYQWLFYIFPHYWVFQIFQNIYTGSSPAGGYFESCSATIVTSILFLMVLLPLMRKKLKMR